MATTQKKQTRYQNFVRNANNPQLRHYYEEEMLARWSDHQTQVALNNFFCNFEMEYGRGKVMPHSFSISQKEGYYLATIRARQTQKPVIAFLRGVDARTAVLNLAFSLEHNWLTWREDKWRKS